MSKSDGADPENGGCFCICSVSLCTDAVSYQAVEVSVLIFKSLPFTFSVVVILRFVFVFTAVALSP